jgi:tetratricopeptide (TPR) repeat protein
MREDSQGLALSTDSDQAAAAFAHVIAGYLGYRADLPARMAALMAADAEFGLAHCLQGYMAMLGFKQALVPAARQAAASAARLTAHATPRERRHAAALAAWVDGELEQAIAIWEAILAEHPHDVLAIRLSHFVNFWLGRAADMAASIERVLPHWSVSMPGYATLLACRCFALEECGNYLAAEPNGRRAIELTPGDLWAAHAVAHVMEMQGRRSEGIAWLSGLEQHWEGGNNLLHHLWWHRALYHLEQGDFATVLRLYDQNFRNLGSPLTAAAPDVYIDVQNAASMLFRLERLGVAIGDRWTELADLAETRIGDNLSGFTLPHWIMALAATGRTQAAERMLETMRQFGNGSGTLAPLVRDYALPIARAICAHHAGQHAEAVALMRPALGGMWRLGGSHAQQDVLEQFFLEAAARAGQTADIRLVLERAAGRRAIPLERMAGWQSAARQYPL